MLRRSLNRLFPDLRTQTVDAAMLEVWQCDLYVLDVEATTPAEIEVRRFLDKNFTTRLFLLVLRAA